MVRVSCILFLFILRLAESVSPTVYHLLKIQTVSISGATKAATLTIFCWKEIPPTVSRVWASGHFLLDIESNDYKVYTGPNVSTVEALAVTSESYWHITELPWRFNSLRFNPFQDCCIGVSTSEPYQIQLQYLTLNFMLFFFTLTSFVMYLLAPFLARNTTVHYSACVIMGISLSLVFITYMVQRRFRQSFFSWMFIVYTVSVYMMINSWYNLNTLFSKSSLPWLLGYCLVTGLVSWVALYRLGTPSHPRTISLIQWTLQGFSMLMLTMSSYNTMAIIMMVSFLLVQPWLYPGTLSNVCTLIKQTFMKPKRQLLTVRQVEEQSERETRLAMEKLRRHCQSLDSDTWALVVRLSSPGKFAEFVQGGSDVTEEEVEEYRAWVSEGDVTDATIDVLNTNTEETVVEPGHRFTCFLCNDQLLGHRFSCGLCMQD